MDIPVKDAILSNLERMSPEQQQAVLAFTAQFIRSEGEDIRDIIEDARNLNFSKEDLDEITRAVEDFEHIDEDSW